MLQRITLPFHCIRCQKSSGDNGSATGRRYAGFKCKYSGTFVRDLSLCGLVFWADFEQISLGFLVTFLVSGLGSVQDLCVSQPHGDVMGGSRSCCAEPQ